MRTGTRALRGAFGVAVLLVGCQTTGLNPTGLHGTEVRCPEGPRQTLDCRGAIQQYARDFRADVSYMQQVAVGVGVLSNKRIEADANTSDLVQHYYPERAVPRNPRPVDAGGSRSVARFRAARQRERLRSVGAHPRPGVGDIAGRFRTAPPPELVSGGARAGTSPAVRPI